MYYSSSSSFTGNSTAAAREIITVKIITLIPSGIWDIKEKAKLRAKERAIIPAIILFSLAGGIIIAKNIP